MNIKAFQVYISNHYDTAYFTKVGAYYYDYKEFRKKHYFLYIIQ